MLEPPVPPVSPSAAGSSSEFQQHVTHTFFTQVVSSGIQLTCGVLIARGLGPAGKGELALAVWVSQLLYAFWYMGIGEAGLSVLNRGQAPPQAVVGTLTLLAMGLIALGGVAYWSLAPWALHLLQGKLSWALYQQTFWLFPLMMVWVSWCAALLGLGRVMPANWGRLLNQAVLLVLVLLWFAQPVREVPTVLWAFIAAAMAEVAFVACALRRQVPLRPAWHLPVLGRLLRIGSQLTVGSWLDFLTRRLDVFLVSLCSSTAGVGLYAVAAGLRDAALVLPQVFIRPMLSATSRSPVSATLELVGRVSRQVVVVLGVVSLVMLGLLPWLIRQLYSSAFDGAVAPARWLFAGFIAVGLSDILTAALVGIGKPKPVIVARATVLGCLLVGGSVFSRFWGVSGIAAAVALSQLAGLTSLLVWFRRNRARALAHP